MKPNDEASARKRRHESWEARDKDLWAQVEAGTITVNKYLQRIAEPLEGDHNEGEVDNDAGESDVASGGTTTPFFCPPKISY